MEKLKLPRCNALDSNGKQCRKHSAIVHDYHGSYELYGNLKKDQVLSVRIHLCIEHAFGVNHDFTH